MTVLMVCLCLFCGGGAFAFFTTFGDLDLSVRRSCFWVALALWFLGVALAGSVVWRAMQ